VSYDRGPNYVQSWFAFEWLILFIRVVSWLAGVGSVVLMFFLCWLFPGEAVPIILGYVGFVIVAGAFFFIWGVSKALKRPPPYDPSTDTTTSAYRWDAMSGGPVRDNTTPSPLSYPDGRIEPRLK
jgi:hypothetical protein